MRPSLLLVAALLTATSVGAVPTAPASSAEPALSARPGLQSTPGKFDPLPDEMVGAALVARAVENADTAERLAGLDAALAELPRPTRFRGVVQAYRGAALAELDRLQEAQAALEEAHRLLPDHMGVTFLLGQLLILQHQVLEGVKLVAGAIEVEPPVAEGMSPAEYDSAFRQLRYARDWASSDRLMVALAKSGYAARHPDFGSRMAKVAIRSRLDADDVAGAASFLPLLTEAGPVIEMVVNKRYRKLWPAIDAWSGGDLHDMRVATLNAATATFKANPKPALDEIRICAEALWQTGNADAAITQLQTVLADPERWDENRDEATTIATLLSGWQFTRGAFDASLETAKRYMAITPPNRFPQVRNLMVNQAMRLAMLGQADAALAALDRAEDNAETDRNFEGDGAQLWFDSVRACAGRGPAAKAAQDRLERKGAAINPSARNASLACRGDTAALVRIAVAELAVASSADLMAVDLRRIPVSDLPALTLSVRTWQAVARDPAVVNALDKVSRPIPLSYVRAANKWRH